MIRGRVDIIMRNSLARCLLILFSFALDISWNVIYYREGGLKHRVSRK